MYRIKEIAKSKGIQMKEIAKQIGVEANTLSRINSGDSTNVATLQAIAKILDVNIKELFKGDATITVVIEEKLFTFHSKEDFKNFAEEI
ncbi:helix-turn-helix domain-containing protein [Tenacibaculum dicentrarchi]|uniref:helix-turn-helix domain-containing protein n=1 Tax=Tenacibaculum dicentrarchi TaxID=669041 RepID=UPI003517F243